MLPLQGFLIFRQIFFSLLPRRGKILQHRVLPYGVSKAAEVKALKGRYILEPFFQIHFTVMCLFPFLLYNPGLNGL
jgi:hypothetical protein